MTQHIILNRHQWEVLFRPETVLTQDGAMDREITDTEELRQLITENRLWTEMDDGSIQSGYHFVNRLRYLATTVPVPYFTHIYVDDIGDVQPIARSYLFLVRIDTPINLVRTDADGIPYIYWSFDDLNEDWADDDETYREQWVPMNQMGERFTWEGEHLND